MRILLVNDDGINAEGIRTLMRTLSKEHEVFAVAPDRQRSAASMAMTLDTPLRAVPVPVDLPVAGAFAVDGTPLVVKRHRKRQDQDRFAFKLHFSSPPFLYSAYEIFGRWIVTVVPSSSSLFKLKP